MASDTDSSSYREHRTREELNALLSHGHHIPAGKGLTWKYVEANFPGWTWNQLIAVLSAAGILDRRGNLPRCDDRVKLFHFNSSSEFLVEWRDGVDQREPPETVTP